MGGLLLPAHGTIQCALGQICAAFYAVGHFNLAFPGQICYYKRADCPYLNRVWGLHCSFGIGVPVSLFDRFGAPTPGRFFILSDSDTGQWHRLQGVNPLAIAWEMVTWDGLSMLLHDALL